MDPQFFLTKKEPRRTFHVNYCDSICATFSLIFIISYIITKLHVCSTAHGNQNV